MSQGPKVRTHNYGPGDPPIHERQTKYEYAPYFQKEWTPVLPPTVEEAGSLGFRTQQLLQTQGNLAPYARLAQNGGAFLMKEFSIRYVPHRLNNFIAQFEPRQRWVNNGDYYPLNTIVGTPDTRTWLQIQAQMSPMGTKGWNRFRPGKPVASLSQFLGELRQLPKNPVRMAADMVRTMRRGGRISGADALRRSVGDHYLNWSFGWRPFLDDLAKLADFNQNLGAHVRQLRRDNGRAIRRGGTIASSSNTTTTVVTSASPNGYMQGPYTSWLGPGQSSSRTTTILTKERYWFAASFVYRLPHGNPDSDFSRLRQYLQGGGLSPSIVWELTPWSWLADYFTNIGDVLENWEAQRELNLAAKYAYVMYQKEVNVLSEHRSRHYHATYGELEMTGTVTSSAVTKARMNASAYGLGFTSGSFNNSQIANLTALGLSRRV